MTDEEKKVEVETHEDCGCKVFSKFLMLTAAIFTGTLLAMLVAKALMAPPCQCPYQHFKKFNHGPAIERQLPPPPNFDKPIKREKVDIED